MQHHAEAIASEGDEPVYDETIERDRALVLQLVREVDPEVQVELSTYRWHGQATLDIRLSLGGHDHALQVTGSRLGIVEEDHEILKHDIEEAVHDLHRHGGHAADHAAATSEAGMTPQHHAAAERPTDMAQPPPAAVAPLEAHDDQIAGHAAETPADVRAVFDATRELARHLVHEMDPEVNVSFDEYVWHGTPTLDIVLERHGHDHHYEITAGRAAITLQDHDILHHDLEGIVEDLRT